MQKTKPGSFLKLPRFVKTPRKRECQINTAQDYKPCEQCRKKLLVLRESFL